MSLPIIAGVATSTKILQAGYPKKNRDEAGRWSLEYLYVVEKSAFESEAPAHGSAAPAPENVSFTTISCNGIEMMTGEDPHNVYMRVMYVEPSYRSFVTGSETVRSSQAVFVERSVEQLGLGDSEVKELKNRNIAVVPYFTVSYHRRSHDGSFAWNETNIVDGLGKREAPDGMSSPTLNLWLKTERSIVEVDSGVEIDEAWTYDENGWDTTIYGGP